MTEICKMVDKILFSKIDNNYKMYNFMKNMHS